MLDNGNVNSVRTDGVFSCIPKVVMRTALLSDKLNICHTNVQSLCARQLNKLDEFKICFENSNIDIICVTETWLTSNISDEMVAVEGYRVIRNDRSYARGGGISIYCKNDLRCRVIAASDLSDADEGDVTEYVFAEVSFNHNKFLLGVVYNPPRNDCSEIIEQKMAELSLHYQNVVLVGDFNIDMNVINARTSRFQSVMDNFDMHLINREPTHFHPGGCSLIDLFITNIPDFVVKFNQVAAAGFSKHDMIFASLNISRSNVTSYRTFRNYAQIDYASLNDALYSIDWDHLYSITDSDTALDFFNFHLTLLFH